MVSEKEMSPENRYWTARLEKVAEALKDRHFGVSVHATAAEAAEHLVNNMLGKKWKGTVNFGGSASVTASGVVPLLAKIPGAKIIETHAAFKRDEKFLRLRREHFLCDLYLCSSNAVTAQGQLLNVDGLGNRVASMIYGPDKVVLFVGRNKICENLEMAEDRLRNLASPMNCIRLNLPNPCTKAIHCMDCKAPGRICNYRVVTERSNPADRIHVLLINEELGF